MAMAMSTAMAGSRSLHLLGEPLHRHQRALFGAAAREENLAGASSSGLYLRGILSSSGLCVSGVLRSSFVPRREVVERRCGVVVVEASSIAGAAGDGGGGSEELGFEGAVPETVSGETVSEDAKLAERLQLGAATVCAPQRHSAGRGFVHPVVSRPPFEPCLQSNSRIYTFLIAGALFLLVTVAYLQVHLLRAPHGSKLSPLENGKSGDGVAAEQARWNFNSGVGNIGDLDPAGFFFFFCFSGFAGEELGSRSGRS